MNPNMTLACPAYLHGFVPAVAVMSLQKALLAIEQLTDKVAALEKEVAK